MLPEVTKFPNETRHKPHNKAKLNYFAIRISHKSHNYKCATKPSRFRPISTQNKTDTPTAVMEVS